METFFLWINAPHFATGFFLPFAIAVSLVIERLKRQERVMPPAFLALTMVGVLATYLLELATPDNNGIWLVPAWLVGYIAITAKIDPTLKRVRLNPSMAFYGTFFSVLVADVFAAWATGFPLQYLGGMGIFDGLLLYPIIGSLLTWVADKEAMRTRSTLATTN